MNTVTIKKSRRLIFVLCFLLIFSLFSGLNVKAYSKYEDMTKEKWKEDIEYLAKEVCKTNKDMFREISKEEFNNSITNLENSLENLNDDEIKIELYKIIASIGDEHAGIYEKSEKVFPLFTHCISDDIYVMDTDVKYKKALYTKIIKINGRDIKDVKKEFEAIIPHKNQFQVKKRIPGIMINCDKLYGLKINDNKDNINITFERKDGTSFDMVINSIKRSEKPTFAAPKVEKDKSPLYLQNSRENYWFKYLNNSKTMYIVYNRCIEMKEKPFKDFKNKVFECIKNNAVDKVVIDMRNNGGGRESVLYPLMEEIAKRNEINKKNKLFVVVGRNTFSSAVINAAMFKEYTNAIFVGEPTSMKPDHFGCRYDFELPNSKMVVSCSTKYCKLSALLKCISEEQNSFVPDIIVENSVDDYINYKDRVLETIIKEY